jgi:hypothetical protein
MVLVGGGGCGSFVELFALVEWVEIFGVWWVVFVGVGGVSGCGWAQVERFGFCGVWWVEGFVGGSGVSDCGFFEAFCFLWWLEEEVFDEGCGICR